MSAVRTQHPVRRFGGRGFTLVEVLLATFIIALGLIGLIALFAGAARQQQLATQSTVAAFAAANAESLLVQNFGTLRTRDPDRFPRDVWYRLPMHEQQHYLSVNPRLTRDGPYFLLPPSRAVPIVLYSRAADSQGFLEAPGVGYPYAFTGSPPPPPFDTLTDLGERRIDPDSLTMSVIVSRVFDVGGVFERVNDAPLTLYRDPGATYPSDAASGNQLHIYTLNGIPQHDPLDPSGPFDFGYVPPGERTYIIVNCELDPAGTQQARIDTAHIGAANDSASSARVERVSVTGYNWLNDRLVSLRERLVLRADASAPGGERAEQGYSVLFRRSRIGFQAAIVSYLLTPPSSAARYIPPEAPSDLTQNAMPVRRVQLTLRYDRDEEAYYFRTALDDDQWAIEPGQLLLVEGENQPNEPGSDSPVRVVRKVREQAADGGQWRGYLDRAPRAGNRNLLSPALRQSGGGRVLRVLAVAGAARSRADGTIWRLTPLEIRVIQVPLQ